MIAVHLKQPVIVDLTLPFRAFIDDNFSTTEADSTRQAIQEMYNFIYIELVMYLRQFYVKLY